MTLLNKTIYASNHVSVLFCVFCAFFLKLLLLFFLLYRGGVQSVYSCCTATSPPWSPFHSAPVDLLWSPEASVDCSTSGLCRSGEERPVKATISWPENNLSSIKMTWSCEHYNVWLLSHFCSAGRLSCSDGDRTGLCSRHHLDSKFGRGCLLWKVKGDSSHLIPWT